MGIFMYFNPIVEEKVMGVKSSEVAPAAEDAESGAPGTSSGAGTADADANAESNTAERLKDNEEVEQTGGRNSSKPDKGMPRAASATFGKSPLKFEKRTPS